MTRALLLLALCAAGPALASGQLIFSNVPGATPIPIDKALLKRNGSIEVTCKLSNGQCPGLQATLPTPGLTVVSIPAAGGDVVLSWSLGGGVICEARKRGSSSSAPFWVGRQFMQSGTAAFGPVPAGSYRLDLICYGHVGAGESPLAIFQVQ